MATVRHHHTTQQWLTATWERIASPATVTVILWLVSVFYAPLFFFVFGGADDSNLHVEASAGYAVLASFSIATIIVSIGQSVVAKSKLQADDDWFNQKH